MASTRKSFLRGAAPGNVGAAFEEAILSSIAKRLDAPVADKKGRVQRPRTAKRITGGHPQSKAKRQSPAFSPDTLGSPTLIRYPAASPLPPAYPPPSTTAPACASRSP